MNMTPRQISARLSLSQRKRKRDMASALSIIQVATSQHKRSVKSTLKELQKDSD